MSVILKVLYLMYFTAEMESARILGVFPAPSISHQVVFRPLMHELAKRGHEVVVITPNPAFPKGRTPENLTEIDVQDVSYEVLEKFLAAGEMQAKISYAKTKQIYEMFDDVFAKQMRTEEVQALINDESKRFDLLIIESLFRIAISLQYVYKVPVIEFSSFGGSFKTFDGTGALTNPLFYPLTIHEKLNSVTIWDKISKLYKEHSINRALDEIDDRENRLAKELFGPDVPDLNELRKNVQVLFLNTYPIWDYNRPVPPNVIYLGGIHQNPSKELPKDLKEYLDASKNGVIYISFGSNVRPSILPQEKINVFTNVFSQLPYDVLWKWDSDDLPGRPKNARISKWLPQTDLLKHPKIKLFITQGGLQSTDEALDAGVPLIGIPFYGDQFLNVEQYDRLKIGIQLDIETVTENILMKAIETIIHDNNSYRENVARLRDIMHDQPQSSLARAVWWTELVLRRGGEHLRAAAATLSWAEYYAVDVVLTLLAMALTVLCAIVLTIRFVLLKFLRVKIKIQ